MSASGAAIKVLPPHLANQIAAGEVVQRPESVVKELIENALDAGADHVTLYIANAGKSLVQVIDNGAGIAEADLPLAFERHATSKIASYEDLEQIMTFGFRGEALPSIAAVAQVEIRSRTAEEELATLLRISGGAIEETTKAQAEPGTSVAVRNLYFNTPARRQFMKSNATEFRHIHDTFQRYLLSSPDVRWTMINDGQALYDIPPGTLRDRVKVVFGEKVGGTMIEIREATESVTIAGYLSRPNFARKTRGDQFLFLNGRFVVHRAIQHAVVSSYEQMIQQNEFPPFVLYLSVNPREVDVNVHPAKLEVKFGNERMMYSLVQAVVRKSLYDHDLSPSIAFREPEGEPGAPGKVRLASPWESATPGGRESLRFPEEARAGDAHRERPPYSPLARPDLPAIESLFRDLGATTPPEDIPAGERADRETPARGTTAAGQSIVWQLHNKYLLTPIKSGLMIVDQHVAHERILYERALATMESVFPFSQQLLFPHQARMLPDDFLLLEELREELTRLGFILALSPPNFVTVEAVPQDVRVGMEERILEEMLEQYREYQQVGRTDVRDNLAASYACRGAIKAGDPLNPEERQNLIDQLFAAKNPYVCPHGRPVVIKLSLEDIDRKFGRTS